VDHPEHSFDLPSCLLRPRRSLYFRIHSLDRQLDGVDPYVIQGVKAMVISE
jgi:hypothetical protein